MWRRPSKTCISQAYHIDDALRAITSFIDENADKRRNTEEVKKDSTGEHMHRGTVYAAGYMSGRFKGAVVLLGSSLGAGDGRPQLIAVACNQSSVRNNATPLMIQRGEKVELVGACSVPVQASAEGSSTLITKQLDWPMLESLPVRSTFL